MTSTIRLGVKMLAAQAGMRFMTASGPSERQGIVLRFDVGTSGLSDGPTLWA